MRIVLADDDEKVRSALRLLVQEVTEQWSVGQQEDGCVTAEAADAAAVLSELSEHRADLLLLDWELPGMPACQLLGKIRQLSPHCVIIAMSGRPEAARLAIGGGADAFVSKNEPPDRLVSALLRSMPTDDSSAQQE